MKIRASLLVASLVLAGATLPIPATRSQQARIVVTIGFDGQNITVSPDPALANRGDTVDFQIDAASDIRRLQIRFDSEVPFGERGSAPEGLGGDREIPARGLVRSESTVGERYKYTIRAFFQGRRPIELDPEIEIGPG